MVNCNYINISYYGNRAASKTHPGSVPDPVAPADLHHFSGEEAVLDEGVDVLAELHQPAAVAQRSQVEEGHQQRPGKAAQALPRTLLALHRLQVREARSPRERTAPHKAVAEDGPLKELTVEERRITFTCGYLDTWNMLSGYEDLLLDFLWVSCLDLSEFWGGSAHSSELFLLK